MASYGIPIRVRPRAVSTRAEISSSLPRVWRHGPAGIDSRETTTPGAASAAYSGSAEIVETLVKAGADRTVVEKYGDTAFDLGKREGNLDSAALDLLRV